jgi:hypothetical protein
MVIGDWLLVYFGGLKTQKGHIDYSGCPFLEMFLKPITNFLITNSQ